MIYQQKIQKILSASGLSQEALSSRLGVSFVTLNSWVNGKSEPKRTESIENIDRLFAELFGEESIDHEELKTLKTLALKTKLSARKLVENRELLDKITLHLTYHTNTIEGSTMTLSDVSNVLFDNKILSNRTATEQREAVNHQTALNFLLDELNDKSRPFIFSVDLIRATHLRMMNGILSNAGLFRNHSVRIVGSRVPLTNFIKIEESLLTLCNKLNEETSDPIGLLAETHAKFEQIHPFSDGNGRTGRLIMFAMALKFGIFPPIIEKERKQAYYRYLEQAQLDSRYDALEKLIAESIIKFAP